MSYLKVCSTSIFEANYLFFLTRRLSVLTVASRRLDEHDWVSFQTFLETNVPSLFRAYLPARWLPNGHAQTIYTATGDFTKVDQIQYERYAYLTLSVFQFFSLAEPNL